MGLKSIFDAMKAEDSYVLRKLDTYLVSLNAKDNDRAPNVNSPSQASVCNRANYYARMGYQSDGSIDARTRRIFDNGTHVHIRLQEYLLEQGVLISDEVPCINEEYNIQGHTDGFLSIGKENSNRVLVPKGVLKAKVDVTTYSRVAILEIKSINSANFTQLKDAKEAHKEQAMIYCYCAEQRRLYLKSKYATYEAFHASMPEREKHFRKRYDYLQDGRKHSREEKINFQVKLCLDADEVLYNTVMPIDTVVYIYENKDTQDIKEFSVKLDKDILQGVLDKYKTLNECIDEKILPPREGTSKSCSTCRWCNYKIECFG